MSRTTEHKEGRATVRILYRTDKVLKDGLHPFWVRITKDRKSKYVSTGLALHPKYWNEQHTNYRDAIRKSYPASERTKLIDALTVWENKYNAAAVVLTDADEQHDAKAVATKAIEVRKQARKTTLLAYIDHIIDEMVSSRKTGNSNVYRDLRNQLAKFISDEYSTPDISFEKVTVKFCNEWEATLRATGAIETSLSIRFRTLRAVMNRAISNGYAKPDNYPFTRTVADKHKFSVSKFDTSTVKRAISRESVQLIEAYQPKGTAKGPYADIKNRAEIERFQRAKDVFLFSFYVAGINFVDLAKLRWRNIQVDDQGNQRVNYIRQKTGGKFSLKLLEPACAIIERYKPSTFMGADSYIFPILNTTLHSTPDQINNRLHKVLGQTNLDLKAIGKEIGITIPLTTYVARHSFATNLKRAGHANAVIGQAMGHRNESTTNIYLDDFGSDAVDSAFDSLLYIKPEVTK